MRISRTVYPQQNFRGTKCQYQEYVPLLRAGRDTESEEIKGSCFARHHVSLPYAELFHNLLLIDFLHVLIRAIPIDELETVERVRDFGR